MKPKQLPCAKCVARDKEIAELVKTLDCEKTASGSLVMWPGTDMTMYAITVEIAGLLQRELEVHDILTLLFQVGIRADGNVVAGVKRLADMTYNQAKKEKA